MITTNDEPVARLLLFTKADSSIVLTVGRAGEFDKRGAWVRTTICLTPSGIVIETSPVSWNAAVLMLVIESLIATVVNWLQPAGNPGHRKDKTSAYDD